MSHPQPHSHESLHTRVTMAKEDLREADELQLAAASNASLIAAFVKVRSSLADMIRVIHEHDLV